MESQHGCQGNMLEHIEKKEFHTVLQVCYLQPHFKAEERVLCICKIGGQLERKVPDSWVASSVLGDRVSEQLQGVDIPLSCLMSSLVEAPKVIHC